MANPVGRPSKYKQSTARAICLRLMLGQSLNEICKLDKYPSKITVFTWLQKHKDFLNQYRHAREVQQETHLDEMLEIADDGSNDWMERTGKDGEAYGWQINGEHVQRSKLRVDTRKWIMERMAPKVYGNKQSIDHTTAGQPMQPTRIVIEAATSDDDRDDQAPA